MIASKAFRKHQAHLLLWSANIWYFGDGMFGPLFAVFAEQIGGNIFDITWAWATYLAVTGILVIFIGKFSDRHFRKETLLFWGYVINAIFTFGYLFVENPLGLFIVQAGLGVSVALASPTWNALFARNEDKKNDGYLWGLAAGYQQLMYAVAIVIGGFIVTYASFKLLFITMGIIQTIAAIYTSKLLKKDTISQK